MQVSGSLRLCHDGDQDAGTCLYFLSFLSRWSYIYDTNSCISMARYLQLTQLKWQGASWAGEVEYRYNFWDNRTTHTHLKSFASYCLHSTSSPTLRCSAAGVVLSMSIRLWVLLVEMTLDTACGNDFGFTPAGILILPLPLTSSVPWTSSSSLWNSISSFLKKHKQVSWQTSKDEQDGNECEAAGRVFVPTWH